MVQASVLAGAPVPVPLLRQPRAVDPGEQARVGGDAPDDRRAEVRRSARRDRRLHRGRLDAGRVGDERLGRGPAGVVAGPRGEPQRGHPPEGRGAMPRTRPPRRGDERERLWRRWAEIDEGLDA